MFNEPYGLQQAVFDRLKPITRREPYFGEISKPSVWFYAEGKDKGRLALCDGERFVKKSHYRMNEIVAVAQDYQEVMDQCKSSIQWATIIANTCNNEPGYHNKMYVKAELMPHQIRITDIKVERLHDISNEDCLQEGITMHKMLTSSMQEIVGYSFANSFVKGIWKAYNTPREAFATLINKVSGKGTWEKNPWVFVYSFELVK